MGERRARKPAVIYTHVFADDIRWEMDPERGLVVWRAFKPLERFVIHSPTKRGDRRGRPAPSRKEN